MRKYEKYEFCSDIKCKNLLSIMGDTWCKIDEPCGCLKSAKEFHKWLKKNDFVISKNRK